MDGKSISTYVPNSHVHALITLSSYNQKFCENHCTTLLTHSRVCLFGIFGIGTEFQKCRMSIVLVCKGLAPTWSVFSSMETKDAAHRYEL